MGAWIETIWMALRLQEGVSLPVWERGLKQVKRILTTTEQESLPVWERGLKQAFCLLRIR